MHAPPGGDRADGEACQRGIRELPAAPREAAFLDPAGHAGALGGEETVQVAHGDVVCVAIISGDRAGSARRRSSHVWIMTSRLAPRALGVPGRLVDALAIDRLQQRDGVESEPAVEREPVPGDRLGDPAEERRDQQADALRALTRVAVSPSIASTGRPIIACGNMNTSVSKPRGLWSKESTYGREVSYIVRSPGQDLRFAAVLVDPAAATHLQTDLHQAGVVQGDHPARAGHPVGRCPDER